MSARLCFRLQSESPQLQAAAVHATRSLSVGRPSPEGTGCWSQDNMGSYSRSRGYRSPEPSSGTLTG